MNDQSIAEILAGLDAEARAGRQLVVGKALFEWCSSNGLVSMDISPPGANPSYRGLCPVNVSSDMAVWAFEFSD